jgi:hypothetical protein
MFKRRRGSPICRSVSGDQRPRADEPAERPGADAAFGARKPWRIDTSPPPPARLAVLLVALAGLSVGFLAIRTNVLRPVGERIGVTAAACPTSGAPEVVRVPVRALPALGRPLASLLPGGRVRLYESGAVPASVLWTDDSPTPPGGLGRPGDPAPAGYEARWWYRPGDTGEDDVAADVLELRSASAARDLAARAASTRCRRDAGSTPALVQPQARMLSWVNPDNAAQWNVIFARGRFVYSVDVVPPAPRGRVAPRAFERRHARVLAQVLACELPGAGCRFAHGSSA